MSGVRPMEEYEAEPIRGLPERLPEGEEILWQGAPCWKGLARRVFHIRKVAFYFGLLGLWCTASALSEGRSALDAALSAAWLVPPALLAMGLLALFAWLNSRATVYTITNRRVVMRFGIALAMAVNLPFRSVESAALKPYADGSGDISLVVGDDADSCGYLMMWPHARPWSFGRKLQPMLRVVPEAHSAAQILARALAASAQQAPRRVEPAVSKSASAASVATAVS